jgi:hypothetical protein
MSETLATVLTAAVAVILLGGFMSYNAYRKETRDNSRQDIVADRVALVAKILQENSTSINGQLERIHTLVNSNMTAQMEDSLASKKAELAALIEVRTLKEAAGLDPTAEARAVIKETTEAIARKEAELADRLTATSLAELHAKE